MLQDDGTKDTKANVYQSDYFKYSKIDLKIKTFTVSILGPHKSGKSQFVDIILENPPRDNYVRTIGVDFRMGSFNYKGVSFNILFKEYPGDMKFNEIDLVSADLYIIFINESFVRDLKMVNKKSKEGNPPNESDKLYVFNVGVSEKVQVDLYRNLLSKNNIPVLDSNDLKSYVDFMNLICYYIHDKQCRFSRSLYLTNSISIK